MKKKISLYTTSGEIAGTTYYRIYQYLDNDKFIVRKRPRLTNKMYTSWMPISSKSMYFKLYAFLIFYFRNLFHLIIDCFYNPNTLVLSRTFLNRVLPHSYKFLIKYLKKKGTTFIWDFDDDIISSRELTKKNFNWMCEISTIIVVASYNNLEMLDGKFLNKTVILPTTDKDMYSYYSKELLNNRLSSLNKEHRLIWVGTATSLPFVKRIIEYIELYGESLIDREVSVIFTIVCNKPLDYSPRHFKLRNILWSRDIAISEMKNSHVGLMPLEDSIPNQRKGGFKLIQYLSIGLPIVGSPIGINKRIISDDVGFYADINDAYSWINSLSKILLNSEIYKKYSELAFKRWNKLYSYEKNLNVWDRIINGSYN